MLRHVVLFAWKPTATPAEKDRVRSELLALPSVIPTIRQLSMGADAGLADGNFDMALVVDFDDVDGYRRYADDPRHQQVIREHIRPILQRRAAVQYPIER